MTLRSLTLTMVVTAGSTALLGCASSSAVDADDARADEELRAACSNPPRYVAAFRDRTPGCRAVRGAHGRWLPSAVLPGASAETQRTTCAFDWSSATGAPPDAASIMAAVPTQNVLAPACGGTGTLTEVEISIGPMGGSVGCDVCGVLVDRKLVAVLPVDDRNLRKQVVVRLSNGGARQFQIGPTRRSALDLTLPPPPPGATYVSGYVSIL